MEPTYGPTGVGQGWAQSTIQVSPPSRAQEAATAWWTARDRMLAAFTAASEARKAAEIAEGEERKAWAALVSAAERDAKPDMVTSSRS